ncbi:MAG: hypothetical protein H6709_00905 [Kofleriaceae bacterium]|nr:hypothetical protein [Kofleriaceae bacterium]MCB9570627.1 hypothetical protein [Kofleriaceae bacterium]
MSPPSPVVSRPPRRAPRLAAAVGVALAASACGRAGALGQATMFKECSPADAGCRRAAPAAPLAVGSRLRPDVQVDVAGSVMPVIALASSRPEVVDVVDGAMIARAPGMAAVVIATPDGTVIDFQHLWVADADRLVVERPSPLGGGAEEIVGPLELVAGESVLLSSTLLGGAQRLAGDGGATWTATACDGCGEVVALLQDGVAGRRRVVARAPGTARVTVTASGVTATVDVAVVP